MSHRDEGAWMGFLGSQCTLMGAQMGSTPSSMEKQGLSVPHSPLRDSSR